MMNIVFRETNGNNVCLLLEAHETISSMIDKYLEKTDRRKEDVAFLFNANKLDSSSSLTIIQARLQNNSVIFVVTILNQIPPPFFPCENKKNKYTDLIPQISIYFPDINEDEAKQFIKAGKIDNLKSELNQIFGNEIALSASEVTLGSILLKINCLPKKFFSTENSEKMKEIKAIKDTINCLRDKSFQNIGNLKPMAVKFINQEEIENKEISERKIQEFLEENMNPEKEEGNVDQKYHTKIFEKMRELANEEEKSLKNDIKNENKKETINENTLKYLEEAFKESIFEYKIVGLVIVDNKEVKDTYEKEKEKCPNCQNKILLHATKINYSSKILTSNFRIGYDNWYGIGTYFADQFDYAKGYYEYPRNFATIPRLGDSFNLVISEVFYDKTKLKQIYDFNYHVVLDIPESLKNSGEKPDDSKKEEEEKEYKKFFLSLCEKYKEYLVMKNGIHYIEVDAKNGNVINEKKEVLMDKGYKKISKEAFIGREYCITDNKQILPLYGITFKRIDFCVIWRDTNFKDSFWAKSLEKNKKIINKMTGYNLYTEDNTKDALKLIWRKRFNKIILITNVGKNMEGKKFVDKVRKILGFNIMVLFFVSNSRHLDWIKNYPNSLFCEDEYTLTKYVCDFTEEGFNKIRENVKEFYGVELSKPNKAFEYPLFEKYKDTYEFYENLNCQEYDDFDDL